MNPRYAIHEEIDRYLNGQMGAAERRLFEEQLASNASVRADFEAQKIAHELIFEDSLLDLKKQMQRDMNGGGSTPPSSGLAKNYRNWLIGLGGILCLSSLYYFYSNSASKEVAPSSAAPVASLQTPVKEKAAPASTESAGALPDEAPQHTQAVMRPVPIVDSPVPAADQTTTPGTKPAENNPVLTPAPVSIPAPAIPQVTNPTPTQQVTSPSPVSDGPASPAPQPQDADAQRPTAFTFQPDVEGAWTLPYKEASAGTFRILSRSGVTVYSTHFSSGVPESWNGNDAAGVPMPAGYYIYLIEYEKGGVEKGSLTILR